MTDELTHLRNLEVASQVRAIRGERQDPEILKEIRELRSRISSLDAPPEITRRAIPLCRHALPDLEKAGRCIQAVATAVTPDEARAGIACAATSDTSQEYDVCRGALRGVPYLDGTGRLELTVGTTAAEEGRRTVSAFEPLLTSWETGRPLPPPPAIEALTAAPRRGRGRPPTVPLADLLSSCMARLPGDLKAKLAPGIPSVVADVEDRIHVAKDQVAEICHQVRDAEAIEPRLSALEGCLCPAPIPSVLQLLTGRSGMQFE